MAAHWCEIDKVIEENRHELVLAGDVIACRLNESGIDDRIFTLKSLNFLEISKCGLKVLSENIGELTGLSNLVLHGNHLTAIPNSIGRLTRLKFLDLSSNELLSMPDSVGDLHALETLNLSCNCLTSLFDPSTLINLHILDVSHNQLTELPDGICCPELALLGTILTNNNDLQCLPADLNDLPSLKLLDISANKLTEIPATISDCTKLKEFNFSDNSLKDRRLAKMMNQCSTKACLDYLHNIHVKDQKSGKSGKGGGDKKDRKKRGGKNKDETAVDDMAQNLMKILHFNTDDSMIVQVTPNALAVRPYIVCCIVRNLNFTKSRTMMKRFIVLQTKLHDGICAHRQAATIATHDAELLKGPVCYDARRPAEIKLTPLLKKNEKTAAALVVQLRREAEELRKERKRNTISGIHKYLELLKGKELYPCLVDNSGIVISFPPITNSNVTKVTQRTRHILIEVTSSTSLEVCKKVMEELLAKMLEMGIGQAEVPSSIPDDGQPAAAAAAEHPEDEESAMNAEDLEECVEPGLTSEQILVVEQVKVIDNLGGLRVIFPSRVDLQSEAYRVLRNYE